MPSTCGVPPCLGKLGPTEIAWLRSTIPPSENSRSIATPPATCPPAPGSLTVRPGSIGIPSRATADAVSRLPSAPVSTSSVTGAPFTRACTSGRSRATVTGKTANCRAGQPAASTGGGAGTLAVGAVVQAESAQSTSARQCRCSGAGRLRRAAEWVVSVIDASGGGSVGSSGRGERIRTSGPQLPKLVLYQAELRPGSVGDEATGRRSDAQGIVRAAGKPHLGARNRRRLRGGHDSPPRAAIKPCPPFARD